MSSHRSYAAPLRRESPHPLLCDPSHESSASRARRRAFAETPGIRFARFCGRFDSAVHSDRVKFARFPAGVSFLVVALCDLQYFIQWVSVALFAAWEDCWTTKGIPCAKVGSDRKKQPVFQLARTRRGFPGSVVRLGKTGARLQMLAASRSETGVSKRYASVPAQSG